ncbi:N-acetyltransferase [Leptospira biflexa]|uniref:Putative acetyltransferase n=1 Tax=Leptospira biflexa serovar Patoc (strain Patoc 1 / ATCC 23582 / Paris) TaxID=456481 RepID=B0SR06_LEPBP|nr:GNAT family N-acetyltransferase [Leptospira biflexa]ABZ94059.1 Acetyltransferase [Leptospira biflexa serovar Patoc strain 'Patoc 1 (Ames)']ABZ97707.1 Putative acetyltransferase [Leptospira biflexa serovar Patoc strain 'Patoc 1 (Paris)']TGM48433.1 N-acetyltransferase [Leptospira biflexa]TGM49101.1 N-acetyltransferase [Leptospira biflexa]
MEPIGHGYTIERITNPTDSLQEDLWLRLHEYSISKLGDKSLESKEFFAILVKEGDTLIAASLCYLFFKGLNLQLLWVAEDKRGQDLGTKLLKEIESEAIKLGATLIFGYSFGFQAPKFYLKLGYEEVGQIPNYPEGQNCYFLCKKLTNNSP